MNKISQTIQDNEKEFDKLVDSDDSNVSFFPFGGDSHDFDEENCKNFLKQAQTKLLRAVVEEIRNMYPEITDRESNGIITSLTVNKERLSHNETKGYDKALNDIKQLIEKNI